MSTLPERLKALVERATPGPWEKDYGSSVGHIKSVAKVKSAADMGCVDTPTVAKYSDCYGAFTPDETEANAELIVALRNALPELLAALENMAKLRKIADEGRNFEAGVLAGFLRDCAAARPTACATKGDGNV